jgi:DNA-binding response OmpR family regulator
VKAQKGGQDGRAAAPAPKLVVLVGESPEWQGELGLLLTHEGYATDRVARLEAVVPLLAGGSVQALFVAASPLAASDLLLLRRIREGSPRTAVVAVSRTPTDPDLKRAFESGATAFLSWPASTEALRHAIDRGGVPSSVASRPSRFPDSQGGTPK